MKTNVSSILAKEVCCGCGTCVGLCPTEAISLEISDGLFVPTIDPEKCIECQLCVECCPVYSIDYSSFNLELFGKQPQNHLLGNCLGCYIGHSTDQDLRYQSTSGGLITQLLIFALENHLIDGALVTRMKTDNPLETEAFIARTKEDIIFASKSKYCPVAANTVLKQLLNEEGKFAVVGLPCHIHGVRKAEKKFKSLEKKIVLHLGLLCSHMVSFSGTEFLLEKKQIKTDNVKKISYRGKGWPGSFSVELENGSDLDIPLFGKWNSYWPIFAAFFFTPKCCTMCPDQTAELADIAFGDAWLPELKKEKAGESVIIARTQTGKCLLSLAKSKNAIDIKSTSCEKVEQSQAVNLVFKKHDLGMRLILRRFIGKGAPRFERDPAVKNVPIAILRSFFIYFNIWVSSKKSLRSVLVRFPFPLFRLYYGVYKFLSLI